jgi:hypothetical protein
MVPRIDISFKESLIYSDTSLKARSKCSFTVYKLQTGSYSGLRPERFCQLDSTQGPAQRTIANKSEFP